MWKLNRKKVYKFVLNLLPFIFFFLVLMSMVNFKKLEYLTPNEKRIISNYFENKEKWGSADRMLDREVK